ncbi:MAG: P-loop NTPase [Euryarchaeota archaeon]|nr:P-loop NTPase [Euryarchaeota archaeon]
MELLIASGKGGVGKSTITASLISLLSKDFKIAAVDADAEAPNLHILFGVHDWDRVEEFSAAKTAYITDACTNCGLCKDVCVYEAIYEKDGMHHIKSYICEGCGACSIVCPVDAIRITDTISGWLKVGTTKYGPLVSAELDVGKPNSGKLVTEEKKIARDWVKEGKAEHIIIDAAAGIGCQVIASISGVNLAILIAEPTPSSLSDLKRMYGLAKHFGVPSKLVINKDGINPDYRGLEEFAEENNIEIIGRVPYDSSVPRAITALRPLVEYAPDSPASRAIVEIADKVKGWFDAR